MIISEADLGRLPASFAMVDGCFDPLQRGHVEYFRFAATIDHVYIARSGTRSSFEQAGPPVSSRGMASSRSSSTLSARCCEGSKLSS